MIEGHEKVFAFLEQSVEDLLTTPADLCPMAQDSLLAEIKSVFSTEDNEMLNKDPTHSEVKKCVASSNMNAAPGNDGLTSFLYQHCWDILGKSLTEVAIAIHNGASPSMSQRTSLMVYGCKANKPANSTDPSHKRRISLLNSDFKIISGIYNTRLKGVADHTLSKAQLSVGSDRRIHHGINKARDAIFAATERNQKCGILDNDYKSAFDYMVLKWVFRVLLAKGIDSQVVNRLYNLYNNHLTVVVVNGIQGRSFPNERWSIRQGDRPSSTFFCYGLDPLLDWLERRLRGIPIYTMNIFSAPTTTELYKVLAYVDDVKPGITSLEEFTLVDKGSALFEAASGCILHRDPKSGKVKFLAIGGWRSKGRDPGLKKEEIPVPYVALSPHLDMVGVKLCADYRDSRALNGEDLQQKIQRVIGPWKGGKFMPMSQRSHSLNTYCLSKIWFKCPSIELRVTDLTKISTLIKSWLFQDQLIKPEDHVLYRSRTQGGLNLTNIKVKAQSLLIKTFLETALSDKFQKNLFHEAIFRWYILKERDLVKPKLPPYYSGEMMDIIASVKEEGILNIKTMSVQVWYKHLLEVQVTHTEPGDPSALVPCRVERLAPNIDWGRSWLAICVPGLTPEMRSFLWKMMHCILPTQERLHRLNMPNATSPVCIQCTEGEVDDIEHALLRCSNIKTGADFLLNTLKIEIPDITVERIKYLDFRSEDLLVPTYLTAATLSQLWNSRSCTRNFSWLSVRANVEQNILTLRKSRFTSAASKLHSMWNASITSP